MADYFDISAEFAFPLIAFRGLYDLFDTRCFASRTAKTLSTSKQSSQTDQEERMPHVVNTAVSSGQLVATAHECGRQSADRIWRAALLVSTAGRRQFYSRGSAVFSPQNATRLFLSPCTFICGYARLLATPPIALFFSSMEQSRCPYHALFRFYTRQPRHFYTPHVARR